MNAFKPHGISVAKQQQKNVSKVSNVTKYVWLTTFESSKNQFIKTINYVNLCTRNMLYRFITSSNTVIQLIVFTRKF